MNQQRQVVYDLRNNALKGNDLRDSIPELIYDYVDDELGNDSDQNYELLDWESIEQNFSSVLLIDIDRNKFDLDLSLIHI